jgi:hypothetical protein
MHIVKQKITDNTKILLFKGIVNNALPLENKKLNLLTL